MTQLSTELAAELRRQPPWMYPWRLGKDTRVPVIGDTLAPVHQTRWELMRRAVAEALAAAGPAPTGLDLACCEGWFAHRLLEQGASSVLGVDLRGLNIRRAELVRDHVGIPAERLAFQRTDVFDLDVEAMGRYDVVLMLGLIYHVENPMELLRRARALTRGLCVIETQLTRQDRPIPFGEGTPDWLHPVEASFAAVVEDLAPSSPIASAPGVLSLVPNKAAMTTMLELAGFEHVEYAEAAFHHDRQYRRRDRAVILAR